MISQRNKYSYLWLADSWLHLELVVRDEDGPGKADADQQRQEEAGVGQGQVGAPGQAFRGQLDESLLHWTDFRSEEGVRDE